eukprot:9229977-Karenia_brevis.AAC.1
MHTVYYGPVMRLTSAMLWRILKSNPWNIHGNPSVVMQRGVRQIASELKSWQRRESIPFSDRINDLTLKMLGPARETEEHHPGGALKLKAAETQL